MQEMWVGSLGQEGFMEEEMSTLSSILAWRIPWTEEPGVLQSKGLQRAGHDWATGLTCVYAVSTGNKVCENEAGPGEPGRCVTAGGKAKLYL